MALRPLTLDAVEVGNLKDHIDRALEIIGQDVIDRYMIQKPRTVLVKITINPGEPVQRPDGQRRLFPEVGWEVNHRIPGASGMTTRAFVESFLGRSVLMVNTNDPCSADPNQGTLFDELPAQKETE